MITKPLSRDVRYVERNVARIRRSLLLDQRPITLTDDVRRGLGLACSGQETFSVADDALRACKNIEEICKYMNRVCGNSQQGCS